MKTKVLIIALSLIVACLNAKNETLLKTGFKKEQTSAIVFTENKGQVVDQNYHPRPDVLFGGQSKGLVFHLRNNGISYQLYRVDKWKEEADVVTKEKHTKIDQQTIYRIDIDWLNINNKALVNKVKAFDGVSNFYTEGLPQGGALNVKSYEEVVYQNLYKSIDLKWYEKNGELKYDYICAAGADYKQIQLQLKGAQELNINSNGELLINTPLGTIIEKAPLVTQQGRELKSNWVLKNNVLSFNIQNLNQNLPYIIDPIVRSWGTYYGGTDVDKGRSCVTDASGNVYMSGECASSTGTVIATAGSHQSTFGGGTYEAFLVKFDASGVRQWATYYGGSGNEYGSSCSTDLSGNVYLGGYSNSGTGTVIASAGSHQSAFGGSWDAFLVKFNSSGVRQWGTYYGGGNTDFGTSCSTDASGNVYLTGQTIFSTGTVIATVGSHQPTSGGGGGNEDAFLVKFNSSGVRQWGTYYGGNFSDIGSSCKTDATGNIYLSGKSSSNSGTDIATVGSHQATCAGLYDAFIAKFNSSGVRQWGTYYGGAGSETGSSCSTDALGNVYLCGETTSSVSTEIATIGSHQSTFASGSYDAFLVKFDGSGVRQWGTYYGGIGSDRGYACSTDISGNIYLAGYTSSNTGTAIATSGSYQSSYGGGWEAFLTKFDASGVRQWGTYYGGSNTESGNSCCTDASGNVYMAGESNSNNGTSVASVGSHQSTNDGSYDAFLVKLMDCAALNSTASVNATVCVGASLNFTSGVSGTITPTYFWNGPNSYTSNVQNPTIAIAGTVNIGVYTVNVNNNGCVETATTQVSDVSALPVISVSNGTICTGSSFTISPSGASTYTIEGGNSVVSPTTNTSYTVIGTSSAGCLSSNTATSNVSIVSLPIVSVNNGTICSGNSFTISPSGANTYTIQGGSSVVSPTSNTSYTVIGTSSLGCLSSNTATSNVTVNSSPSLSVNSGTICTGNSFTISPSGANTYTIQGGSSVVSPTSNTSYTVIGTSSLGCLSSNTATSNVTVNSSPVISVNNGTICSGNSFTIAPSGANTYTIQGGNSVVSPTSNTSYTVIGTSSAGCLSSNTATSNVTVNPLPLVSVNNGTICAGSSFTISPSGANTYTIQGGSSVVSPTSNTSYTVIGTSSLGCLSSNTATSNVTVNPLPIVSVNNGTICSGNSFTISPNGANTYTIQGGNSVVSPTTNTSYTVIGTSSLGCLSSNTATSNVSVNASPIVSVNSGSICSGNSFTISPSGANAYTVQGGNSVVSPTSNTSYTVIGTSSLGCLSGNIATSNVTVNPLPFISVNSGPICIGNSFTISPAGAASYTIQGGNSVVSPTANTSYTVIGTSSAGCLSSNTATSIVSIIALPIISVNNGTICSGNNFTISPSGANTYTIQGGNSVVSPTVNATYTVIGANPFGCISVNTATSNVTVNPSPTVIAATSATDFICLGESATLTATGANSYTWNPGGSGGSISISPTVSTNYTVTGTGSNGCTNSVIISQIVSACTNINELNNYSVIEVYPNPVNDLLHINIGNLDPLNTKIHIVNNLGQIVLISQANTDVIQLNLSELANGMYVVKVLVNNTEIINHKLIKN